MNEKIISENTDKQNNIIIDNNTYHKVKKWDSMYKIAKQKNISLNILIYYNTSIWINKKDWWLIKIWENIWIPSTKQILLIKSLMWKKENLKIWSQTKLAVYWEKIKVEWELLEKQTDLSDIDEINIISKDIVSKIKNLKEKLWKYIIKKWDVLNSIARKNWIKTELLIQINENFWLISKENNYLIYPSNILYIPNRESLHLIKEIGELKNKQEMVQKINTSDYNALEFAKQTQEIYPSSQIPIWFTNILDWFVNAQKLNFEPVLPRIVDIWRQKEMWCSNMLRTLMRFSTFGQWNNEEKIAIEKENVDAWQLPEELEKINFDQDFSELMDYFNFWRLKTRDPIDNIEDYNKIVIKLWEYLNNNPELLKWSLLPLYFNLSKYKGDIYDYNKRIPKNNRHLNTHVSFFAWNWQMLFQANEVNIIKNNQKIDFWMNINNLTNQIIDLTEKKTEIENINISLTKWKDSNRLFKNTYLENLQRIKDINTRISRLEIKLQKLNKKLQETKSRIRLLNEQNITLNEELNKSNKNLGAYRNNLTKIFSDLDTSLGNFSFINRKYNVINKVINKYGFFKDDNKIIPWIKKAFLEIIEQSKTPDDLANNLKNIDNKKNSLAYNILRKLWNNFYKNKNFQKDIIYFFNMIANRKNIENWLKNLTIFLKENPNEYINISTLTYLINTDPQLIKVFKEYNSRLKSIKNKKIQIEKNKNEKNKNQLILDNFWKKQKISIIDFLANFIQIRWDFRWALSNFQKQKIIKWMDTFWDLIKIKVKWKKIDIKEQYALYKNGKENTIQINSDDNIEINWPTLFDGEHKSNSYDINEKKNLNPRTRFFFEFIIAWNYYPTELISPNEKSIFKKKKFDKFWDKLEIDQFYDLKPWELLYNKLKIIITKKEKLDKTSSDYEQKIRMYYGLQVKGLQIYGYLWSKSKINKWSFLINSPIPYFNTKNMRKVHKEYIQSKKDELIDLNAKNAKQNNFLEIKIFSWETKERLFYQIRDLIKPHKTKEEYKIFELIENLDKYSIELFMQKILKNKYFTKNSEKQKTWDNIREWDTLIISLKELKYIVTDIISISKIKKQVEFQDIINFEKLSAIFPVKYFNLLPTFIYSETWYKKWEITFRKYLKDIWKFIWKVKSVWPYQLKLNSINNKWVEELINNIQITNNKKSDFWSINNIEKENIKKMKLLLKSQKPWYMWEIKTILKNMISNIDLNNNPNSISNYINNYLMLKKISSHDQNLSYLLFEWLGENAKDINVDNYNAWLFSINNLWENQANKAMFDNYLRRLIINIWKQKELTSEYDIWNKVNFDEIGDNSIKEFVASKIIYNNKNFITNITKYIEILENNNVEKSIINQLKEIINNWNITNWDIIKITLLLKPIYINKNINTSFLPTKEENMSHMIFNTSKKYYKLKNKNYLSMKIAF